MKKLNQDGSHVIAIVLIVLVVLAIGFVGWRVATKDKSTISGGSDGGQSGESSDPGELIWQQTENGWISSQTPPACPDPLNLATPVDLSGVTSILYPGQVRGGNYKPHGGFRFDGKANDEITVTAPMDGYLVRGGSYLTEGEVQYTLDIMNNCGIMYRVGHLRTLPPNLQAIADKWPAPEDGDSRTESVDPPVYIKKGEVLATAVGIIGNNNVFFDWGVYDYRSTNEASKYAAYQQQHPSKELDWYAVCWFDLLSTQDESSVRALPSADPASGKTSDYCK